MRWVLRAYVGARHGRIGRAGVAPWGRFGGGVRCEGQPQKREEEYLPRSSPLGGGEQSYLLIEGVYNKSISSDITDYYHSRAMKALNP